MRSPARSSVTSSKTDFSGEESPSWKKIFSPPSHRFPIKTGTTRRPFPLPARFKSASAGPHDCINDRHHATSRRKPNSRNAANRLRKPISADHVLILTSAKNTGHRAPKDTDTTWSLVPTNRLTSPESRSRGMGAPSIFRPIEKNPLRSNLLAAQSLLYLSHQFTLLF